MAKQHSLFQPRRPCGRSDFSNFGCMVDVVSQKRRRFPTLGSTASCWIFGKEQMKICLQWRPPPPWIMNLNDGCRMEGCFLILTAWYDLHFARNHSTLGAYSRSFNGYCHQEPFTDSFLGIPISPDISKILQSQKPRLGGFQKPRQQHNQLLHYEQLKARRGVAMLVMCHTKVIVTSAKTSMSL